MVRFLRLIWSLIVFACLLSTTFGQSHWDKCASNPVLSPTPQSGIFAFCDPSLLFDGMNIHLWITGGGFLSGDTVAGVRTYYYTTTDGLSWQPNPFNPVLREGPAGRWDSGHIETPCVISNSGEFWLYYAATPDSAANDGAYLKIGLATSQDGETWIRHTGNPMLERGLPGSWEERQIESPCVIKTDSLFYLWYTGIDAAWKIHVGLATSIDGVNWQKYPGNPVFSPSRGSDWDSVGVYAPQVRWLNDRFVMLYTGLVFSQTGYDFTNTNTGLASSKDGIHWIRVSNQPVLCGTPGDWDESGPFTLDWIETNNQLQMVYVSGGKVGLATSAIDVVQVDLDENRQPAEHKLFLNYPNPFNTETIIKYFMPKTSHLRLAIYDLLGRHIKTIVDFQQQAGHFHAIWNGTDEYNSPVAAGVYFCQIETADFVKVIKLALVK